MHRQMNTFTLMFSKNLRSLFHQRDPRFVCALLFGERQDATIHERTEYILGRNLEFQVDLDEDFDASQIREWHSAVVPMPWQAQFEDLRNTSGIAWYRRHFTVNPASLVSAPENAAILRFGAVEYQAAVWLNSEYLGKHECG